MTNNLADRCEAASGAEPVAYQYTRHRIGKELRIRRSDSLIAAGWTEVPLFAHPPAQDVAALVAALRRYADQFCELGPYTEACGKLEWDQCSGCLARAALAKHERTPHD